MSKKLYDQLILSNYNGINDKIKSFRKPKKKGADIASRRANRRVEGTVKAVAETQKKK